MRKYEKEIEMQTLLSPHFAKSPLGCFELV